MGIRYKIAERVLRRVFEVDESHHNAFTGRLNYLRRNGVPEGVNRGSGRAASYGIQQMWQLGLALELSELGFLPAHAVFFVTGKRWEMLSGNFSQALRSGGERFLYLQPHLMFASEGEVGMMTRDPMSAEGVKKVLGKESGVHNRRHVFIDLAALVQQIDEATDKAIREEMQ